MAEDQQRSGPAARVVRAVYEDPLDAIWRAAAARIGLRIRRTGGAYAATDGRGTLWLGTPATLDPDDCLAQMVFHELCHSLVQGPQSFEEPDWGLDNETDRDLPHERACLRVQAALADRHGLREVLAPTTDHRAFYDALGRDPLDDDDPSVAMARRGVSRAARPPWEPHLQRALGATATIARLVADASLEADASGEAGLLAAAAAPRSRHPTGLFAHPAANGRRCGACAWQRPAGPGPKVPRCRQAEDARVDPRWAACERFEAPLDCRRCGACCREAYEVVEIAPSDPFARKHPELIERAGRRLRLPRAEAGRCAPLSGDGSAERPFTCAVYEDRPRTCRDFERGGDHCLDARRRVGLSL